MKDKPTKKIFIPWKPLALPQGPQLPQLPKPVEHKALNPPTSSGRFPRDIFEPFTSRSMALNQMATEVVLKLHDADGEREIRSCYGDIYKVINALMDYARLLELTSEEWNLSAYHRAVYELYAEDFRRIAKKYQEAIGYDYDAAVAKCEAKKKRQRKREDDIGGDALDLMVKRGQEKSKKPKKK